VFSCEESPISFLGSNHLRPWNWSTSQHLIDLFTLELENLNEPLKFHNRKYVSITKDNSRYHCLPLDIWLYFVLASHETLKLWSILHEQQQQKIPDGEKNYLFFFLIWFTKHAKTSSYIGSQLFLLTKLQNLLGEMENCIIYTILWLWIHTYAH